MDDDAGGRSRTGGTPGSAARPRRPGAEARRQARVRGVHADAQRNHGGRRGVRCPPSGTRAPSRAQPRPAGRPLATRNPVERHVHRSMAPHRLSVESSINSPRRKQPKPRAIGTIAPTPVPRPLSSVLCPPSSVLRPVRSSSKPKISSRQVRADFNDLRAVVHYTKAAHRLGLWHSEQAVFAMHLPPPPARILEAGCGAGRVTMGLWDIGYRRIHAFDFAEELLAQADALFLERNARKDITLFHADARRVGTCHLISDTLFDAVVFMFNGLMQIPGR